MTRPAAALWYCRPDPGALPCCCLSSPQYEEGSAPALAIQATIAKTEARFAKCAPPPPSCAVAGTPLHLC